ncbi:hypothetical protein J2755_002240 [Methanohalophilus levihalophilus]|uniref:hypothetical protein n=1 Tax=Methanohalophilus levihalophilus TaxID=1431282 RepID=UPI001AEB792E|nr:hypothetical protein [Methanohalophilus levihalophilus]MBP2031277.1 hypothetical protein [Methanohalophilus levihalophilus]
MKIKTESKPIGNRFPESKDETSSQPITRVLLFPLALVALIVIAAFFATLVWHYDYQTDDRLQNSLSVAHDEYVYSLSAQSTALAGELEWIAKDPLLQKAMAENDSEQLLLNSQDYFERLQRVHNISLFYFHGPDRVNILRVH